jgi:hypothetical protein
MAPIDAAITTLKKGEMAREDILRSLIRIEKVTIF